MSSSQVNVLLAAGTHSALVVENLHLDYEQSLDLCTAVAAAMLMTAVQVAEKNYTVVLADEAKEMSTLASALRS